MQSGDQRQPIFNAPASAVLLTLVLVAVHGLLELLPSERADDLFMSLAFVPARLWQTVKGLPGWSFSPWTQWITHGFVHADWMHLLINAAGLLTFGSAVARRTGAARMLALFLAAVIAGALLYLALHSREVGALVGASGGISGLLGAAFRFMFTAIDHGRSLNDPSIAEVPLPSLKAALADPRVRSMALGWLAINLALGFLPVGILAEGPISWEAHLGGFLVGFLGYALFDRRPRAALGGTPPAA